MARWPPTKPRKHATQERSRATVDALIEATARILVRDGFDRTSTNRIAEEAGVSVGSLYQYYPTKEALVAAVIERHNEQLMQVARSALAEVAELPVEKAVRRLVAVAIETHRIDPKLHRVLAEQIPHTGRLARVGALNQETLAQFQAYLQSRRDEVWIVDPALAAFLCATTIESVAHTAVLHRSEIFSDAALETLIDETTRLVVGYLRQSP